MAIREREPEISDVLVPNCVYRAGCPEMQSCGLWDRLMRETNGDVLTEDIQERYDLYNAYFNACYERGRKNG